MMGFHLEIQELEEALAEVDLVFHFDIFSSFGQSLFFRMEMESWIMMSLSK